MDNIPDEDKTRYMLKTPIGEIERRIYANNGEPARRGK